MLKHNEIQAIERLHSSKLLILREPGVPKLKFPSVISEILMAVIK